jgi:regulator of replication initiation timing
MALAQDSIRDAVVDGKNQINEASQKLDQVVTENTELRGELGALRADKVLEELSANLPDYKKKYIHKVLCDKSAQFITENFDYTLDLFDKETQKQEKVLTQEAQATVKGGNVDPVVEQEQPVVEESANADDDPMFNSYMGELGKY